MNCSSSRRTHNSSDIGKQPAHYLPHLINYMYILHDLLRIIAANLQISMKLSSNTGYLL